jgi:hypothetical protein
VAWGEAEDGLIMADGLVRVAGLLPEERQIIVIIRVVRLALDGLLEGGQGGGGLFEPEQDGAQPKMGGCEIGLDFEGLTKGRRGFVPLFQGAAGVTQVQVVGGDVGLGGEGALQPLFGEGVVALMVGEQAQEVQGIGMLGMRFEHLPVEGLGLSQLAPLVVLDGLLEKLAWFVALHVLARIFQTLARPEMAVITAGASYRPAQVDAG